MKPSILSHIPFPSGDLQKERQLLGQWLTIPERRQRLGKVYSEAQQYLCTIPAPYSYSDEDDLTKPRFICYAIDLVNPEFALADAAKELIHFRLGRVGLVSSYIYAKIEQMGKPPSTYIDRQVVQDFRLAWLQELAKEFST